MKTNAINPTHQVTGRPLFMSFGMYSVIAFVLAACITVPASGQTEATQEQLIQKNCPIMDNPINPKLFTTYKGKKVYFCCAGCVDTFKADPEKYLIKLPQFAQAPLAIETKTHATPHKHAEHDTERRLNARCLIKPMGSTTLIFLIVAVATAVLRKISPGKMLKAHKIFGLLALLCGIAHAVLVMMIE